MNINIYIETKQKNDKHLCVAIIEAVKNEKILKSDVVKNIVDDLNDFLVDVKNRFNKGISPSMNLSFFSNTEFDPSLVEKTFYTKINKIKEEIIFSEHFEELDNENICPAFIYEIKETDDENDIHLFLISIFFQENIHLVFEFPLFLKMKEKGLIEEDCEVEEFVENKFLEFLKLNKD